MVHLLWSNLTLCNGRFVMVQFVDNRIEVILNRKSGCFICRDTAVGFVYDPTKNISADDPNFNQKTPTIYMQF